VFAGTWNVGGVAPPDDLDLKDWLDTTAGSCDIYVLGFQEIVPLNARNVLGPKKRSAAMKWDSLIADALNNTRRRRQQGGRGGAMSGCREAAARAALAAVRLALIIDPSRIACDLPVRVELMMITADARSIPKARLLGKELIHLIPEMSKSPPRYAGKAMILFTSSFGKRKNDE